MFANFIFSQNLPGEIELVKEVDVNLGKGYTHSQVFVLNEEKFLFSHNSNTGQTDIWNLEKGGSPIYSKKWSSGWTNINFHEFKGKVYFFHQKSSEGTARINRLDYNEIMANKTMGPKIYEDKWSSGWTTTEFFVHNNILYFFHYKKSTGLARLNAATMGGGVGLKLYEKTWSKGYINFAMTANGNRFYILYQKGDEGTCVINNIDLRQLEMAVHNGNSISNLGEESYKKKWSTGWSNICFFTLDHQVYVFFNKNKGGTARIEKLDYYGTLGQRVYDKKWSDGYSEVDIYYQNGKPYLFLQKASTGQTIISELRIKKH